MSKYFWLLVSSVASAILIVLAMPPADIGVLGFVALVPIFLAVRGNGFAFGFVGGMATAMMGGYLTASGWFYNPSLVDADPSWNYVGFAFFGLVIGFMCAAYGETKRHTRWGVWTFAALAVCFEAMLLLYLPAHLALTQYRSWIAMYVASFGGIWLVSFMTWVTNVALAHAIAIKIHKVTLFASLTLIAYALFSQWSIVSIRGSIRLAAIQTTSGDITDLTALQRDASVEDLRSARTASETNFTILPSDASKVRPRIVVWPELSAMAAAPKGDTSKLIVLATDASSAPFITSFEDGSTPMPFNAAAVFSEYGESERYLKRKPFGAERQEHLAGSEAVTVELKGVRYGLNICFDSCFPNIMRDTVRSGNPDVILLPTLDPIAPYGTIQAMHAAFTPFRAAELGVPIVRADASAYSQIVDGTGRIIAQAGSGTQEVILADVSDKKRWTFYSLAGDWFMYLCAAFVVWRGVIGIQSREKSPVTTPGLE